MDPGRSERRLAAIMFTDIVGYTALMAESEEKGLAARERHRALLAPFAHHHHGQIEDENGDELVLSFPSALDAVNCALAVQTELRGDAELQLRIGVHLGDVVFEGGRVYGDGVNLASRIRPFAEPGGICVSEQVYDSVKNQPNVKATSLGEQELKNVARPVEVFALGSGATSTPRPGRRRRLFQRTLVSVGAAFAIAGIAVWATWPKPLAFVLDQAGLLGISENPPLPDKPSIVVLPFDNLSDDPAQDFFADGLVEDLTTDLSRLSYLFVIARNSAFTYKGKPIDVKQVGRELGVRYVLEGSVRRADDRIRVNAQLVDASTGNHIWAERYDRELAGFFSIQSEIIEEILGR